jgi:hypothetical protein
VDRVVKLIDGGGRFSVALALEERAARMTAADLVLGVLGAASAASVPSGVELAPSAWTGVEGLRDVVFERDGNDLVVRDGVAFSCNGRGLEPDDVLEPCFVEASADGQRYLRCEIRIEAGGGGKDEAMAEFARMALLHMLALERELDVTRDYADLADVLAGAEREGLIEVDVKRASYKLSDRGRSVHASLMREAQDLVLKYDIFADVEESPSGDLRFDTGLGRDLRVAAWEREGHDPFKARFLLGLNDGEFDDLPGWADRLVDPEFYDEVFAPVEGSPSVDDVGATKLDRILAAGRDAMRNDDALRQ